MKFKALIFISSALLISACAVPYGVRPPGDTSGVEFYNDKYVTPILVPGVTRIPVTTTTIRPTPEKLPTVLSIKNVNS